MTSIDPCKGIFKPLKRLLGLQGLSSPINAFLRTARDVEHHANQVVKDTVNTYNQVIDTVDVGLSDSVNLLSELLSDIKELAELTVSAYSGYISAIIASFILPVLRKIWARAPIRLAVYIGSAIYAILVLGIIYNVISLFW